MENRNLSPGRINELFNYEKGILIRKKTTAPNAKKGKEAGCLNSSGYKVVWVDGKSRLVHRLVWIMRYGSICPSKKIDHINHNRSDNRIENLRLVSQKENCKNTKLSINNKSGHTGVAWYTSRKKWCARIMVDGKNKTLGYFLNQQEAIKARRKAEEIYGFHINHGKHLITNKN